MWAFTAAAGGDSDSKIVNAVVKQRLVCDDTSPIRGTNTNCTVTSLAGPVTVTEWRFTADDGSVGPVTSSGSTTHWEVPIVVAGRITVQGAIDGQPALPDTAHVTARARDSFAIGIDTGRATQAQTGMECFTTHLYNAPAYGWTQVPGHCNTGDRPGLDPNPDAPDQTGGSIGRVSGGPNDGLWYVLGLQTKLYLRTQILRDLRDDADSFWVHSSDAFVGVGCNGAGKLRLIPEDSVRLSIMVVDSACMHGTGARAFANYLWRHEGCHMARHAATIHDDPPTVAKLDSIESVVGSDSVPTRGLFVLFLRGIRNNASTFSKAIDPINPVPYVTPADTTVTYWGWVGTGWLLQADIPVFGAISPSSICK